MKRIAFYALAFFALVSCGTKNNENNEEPEEPAKVSPKQLGKLSNISLDHNPSHQDVTLPRNVESEGATVKTLDNASWIRHLSISGNMLSFDVEENPYVTTGHRFDTLAIFVLDTKIGTICVSQARNRKSAEKLAWCSSNASFYEAETPKVSGKEFTKMIYNLEKTTNGADSYKNYPAFAYCIEMNHDPENDMEWHLPMESEVPDVRVDDRFSDGYYWTGEGLRNTTSARVYKTNSGATTKKKTEKNLVYAFRNGSAE
jgi:hypothetical protein